MEVQGLADWGPRGPVRMGGVVGAFEEVAGPGLARQLADLTTVVFEDSDRQLVAQLPVEVLGDF